MPAPVVTPDGRYIVIEGKAGPRLWRATNPHLSKERRDELVRQLMDARRKIPSLRGKEAELREACVRIDAAKRELGERGPPWWSDGAPDFNRRLVKNTPYSSWWEGVRASAPHDDRL